MGRNTFDQSALLHFEELAYKEDTGPSLWKLVRDAEDRIKKYPEEADIFGQYFSRTPIQPHHLLAYSEIVNWAITGKLTMFQICISEKPGANAEVDENNRKLSKLGGVFSAEFWGGLAPYDGFVCWSAPLRMNMVVGDVTVARKIIPAETAALEVGTTSFIKTREHLLFKGLLARWPYGHKNIYVMSLDGDDYGQRMSKQLHIENSERRIKDAQAHVPLPFGGTQ